MIIYAILVTYKNMIYTHSHANCTGNDKWYHYGKVWLSFHIIIFVLNMPYEMHGFLF